jgi:hypothetical protein
MENDQLFLKHESKENRYNLLIDTMIVVNQKEELMMHGHTIVDRKSIDY